MEFGIISRLPLAPYMEEKWNIAENLSLKNVPDSIGLPCYLLTSVQNRSVNKGEIFKRGWLLLFDRHVV
jgi:hypothetical protein